MSAIGLLPVFVLVELGAPLGPRDAAGRSLWGARGQGDVPQRAGLRPETDLIIPCSEGVNVSEKNEFILVCPKLVFFCFKYGYIQAEVIVFSICFSARRVVKDSFFKL